MSATLFSGIKTTCTGSGDRYVDILFGTIFSLSHSSRCFLFNSPRLSALSSAAWEMRPFRLHDFCLCLFCLCLWSVCCLLFVWMATAGLWAPCGQGNSSILKRNSLFGCVVLGLTGTDFEEAESGFSGEKGQWQAWRFRPLSTLPFSLSGFLLVPSSQTACFVLFSKAAALQVRKNQKQP